MTFCDADTVTTYNKGIDAETWAKYESKTDSLIYMTREGPDTSHHEAFTINLYGTPYKDSFLNVVKALQKYKQGNIIDTTFLYCDQPIYVEYKMKDKIYYHYYLEGDDTLNEFRAFFSSLFMRPVKKELFDDKLIDYQSEAVNAMKNIGDYQKMEDPYIPVSCAEGIDKTKIYGVWRAINKKFNHKHTFMKLTFTQKDSCYFESIHDGKVWRKYSAAKFNMNSTNKLLEVKIDGQRFQVLKLTDDCITIKWANGIIEYNRL